MFTVTLMGPFRQDVEMPERVIVGRSLLLPIELAGGAMYSLEYEWVARDDENRRAAARLVRIECLMPPITPEADALKSGDAARLPMMDEYGFSASREAEQRRTEWAARGVHY